MRWGWYGPGSGYMRGHEPVRGRAADQRRLRGDIPVPPRVRVERAPHVGPEPGADLGRRGVVRGIRIGLHAGCSKRPQAFGAHGVIGVVDRVTQPGRHGDDRVPFPRHRDQGRGRPAPGGRGAVDHLPGRSTADQVDRGRVHAGGRGGLHGFGAGVGLLHDRVPDGGEPGLGWPDVPLRGGAGEQGAHGGAPTGPQARAPAALGRHACTAPGSRWSSGSCRRATRSSTAPCGAIACAASRTSTSCLRPDPRCGSHERDGAGARPPPIDARAEMLSGARSLAAAAATHTGTWRDVGSLHRRGAAPAWRRLGAGRSRVRRLGRLGARRRVELGAGRDLVASVAHNAAVKGASEQLKASASRCTVMAWWACGSRSRCARITSTSNWSGRRYARSTEGPPGVAVRVRPLGP